MAAPAPPKGSVARGLAERVRKGNLPSHVVSHGVRFACDMPPMIPRIRKALAEDRYEFKETQAALKIIDGSSRVVELGAGIGYMSSVVTKNCAPASYHAFEANPGLLPCIQRVHQENDITSVKVVHALLGEKAGTADFYIRSNFIASSLLPDPADSVTGKVPVPVLPARQAIADIDPDTLICDIEGAELDVIPMLDLSRLRVAIVELHPQYIGLKGVDRVFTAMRESGLLYNAKRSIGKVVTFSRPG